MHTKTEKFLIVLIIRKVKYYLATNGEWHIDEIENETKRREFFSVRAAQKVLDDRARTCCFDFPHAFSIEKMIKGTSLRSDLLV